MDAAVLKSTGSAFENFLRDEYTTLGEVDDRIFSTAVDMSYTFQEISVPAPAVSDLRKGGGCSADPGVKDEKKLELNLQSAGSGDVWDGACA